MSDKIVFGNDLIKVLEKEYKLNKLAEVPTKYKNGITTIDFTYGKVKEIDNLKYDKPYIEFTIDDETDGFVSGTMYLEGGVKGVQFDSYDDLKYFMKNAKWTEKKNLKESNAELKWTSKNDEYIIKCFDCHFDEPSGFVLYKGSNKRIEILFDDLNTLVAKGYAKWNHVNGVGYVLSRTSTRKDST